MGKVFKKITKPIAKVFDKIIPNEIKPALPYLAAVAPFIIPPQFAFASQGIFSNPAVSRAVLSGALNLGSQAAQEGAAERGINPLSLALAAGSGYLSTPGASETLQGAQTVGTSAGGNISAAELASQFPGIDSASQLGYSTDLSFLDQAKNLGLEGLSRIASPLEKATNADLLSMDFVKGAAVPVGMAATEQAVLEAQRAKEEYEKQYEGWQNFTGGQLAEFNAGRKAAILASMGRAGLSQDVIDSTLATLGLRNGGRVGYKNAGIVSLTDEDSGVIYRDENEKPISKEKAMELFNQQAEEESNSRPLDREDILQFYSDAQTTTGILDKILKDKKFKDPNDYRRVERIRNEYVDRKYDLDPTNYPDKKELMDAQKYFDKVNADTTGLDIQINDVMMDQGSKEFGKLYNYGKVKYNSPEGIQIVADKLGIPFEKAKDIKDVFEKSKTKFEYNLEDLDIKRITPKVVIMNKNGETQIMDEDLAKKLNANIIMNSFDTEQILRQENKANGGIIGLMGGGMPSMEMDYRGGGFIPVGAQERADDVPARLSKNEFVMTADAVRAAGGGSVNEGARRMYELMNNLEAKV